MSDAYYSSDADSGTYHVHAICPLGARIPAASRASKPDGRIIICTICAALDALMIPRRRAAALPLKAG